MIRDKVIFIKSWQWDEVRRLCWGSDGLQDEISL